MSDNNNNDGGNSEFLELQNDQESAVKTASHTEVSDPNSDFKGENIVDQLVEENQQQQQSGDSGDYSSSDQQQSGDSGNSGDYSSSDQQQSGGGGDYSSSDQQQSGDGGSGGDYSSSDQQQESGDGNDQSGDGDGGEEGREKKKAGRFHENPDSIPTAGGERLGKKHWGESEIVPDVPKERRDEGVSSSDGQPDQETQDNTARNTGGGDGGDEGKRSLIDKIKDKLPIGGSSDDNN